MRKIFIQLPLKVIKPILNYYKKTNITEQFWISNRENLKKIKEIFYWQGICTENISKKITSHELFEIAAKTPPPRN